MSIKRDLKLKEAVLARQNDEQLTDWQIKALKKYDANKKRSNAKSKVARDKRKNKEPLTDQESKTVKAGDTGKEKSNTKRKVARRNGRIRSH